MRGFLSGILFAALCAAVVSPARTMAQQASSAMTDSATPTLLTAEEVGKILPPAVFFKGLSASVQARNSGGLRMPDKSLVLVTLVDNSGYSSQVQERYQAYLIAETGLEIGGHRLAAGAYGCGFVNGDLFVVMDIGGHDLFTAPAKHDAELRRPTPLQVVAAPTATEGYRLYAGRNYVTFQTRAAH